VRVQVDRDLTTVSWVDRLLGLIKNLGRHSWWAAGRRRGRRRPQSVVEAGGGRRRCGTDVEDVWKGGAWGKGRGVGEGVRGGRCGTAATGEVVAGRGPAVEFGGGRVARWRRRWLGGEEDGRKKQIRKGKGGGTHHVRCQDVAANERRIGIPVYDP
jgi:hypothetical protein